MVSAISDVCVGFSVIVSLIRLCCAVDVKCGAGRPRRGGEKTEQKVAQEMRFCCVVIPCPLNRTGSVMVGRKHCVWFCCDIVVGTVTFQSSCGRKVNILDAESYYVMGIGVQV